jgi:NitT/TauT family transport system ATP-binding protein
MTTESRSGLPIRISRVAKVFGAETEKPFVALKEVSADIAAGEFVSVVGPSGCGKSTLMLMVAGLLSRAATS